MAPSIGNDSNARPMMNHQFLTLIAAILLMGVTSIGISSVLMDSRFGVMDARFAQVDARFEQVDARFEQVDARFEQVDARFERLEDRMDRLEDRMDQMDRRMAEGFREMAVAIARLEGLIQGLQNTAATSESVPTPQDQEQSEGRTPA